MRSLRRPAAPTPDFSFPIPNLFAFARLCAKQLAQRRFVQAGADHAQLAGDVGAAGADLVLAGDHVELEPAVAAVHDALGAQDGAVFAAVQGGQRLLQRFAYLCAVSRPQLVNTSSASWSW